MRKHLPNAVTALRILLALLLAASERPRFWGLYLACGATDLLDGFLARRLHAESALGARLDSIADLIFAAVCAARLLPAALWRPGVLPAVAVIALIRMAALLLSRLRRLPPEQAHSPIGRLTGLLLFLLLPPALLRPALFPLQYLLCAVALAAAAHALYTAFPRPAGKDGEPS